MAEQLINAVTQEWNNDQSVVTFTMKDTTRASVDAYIEGNLEILQTWDTSKTLYTIQDISNPAVSLTPYLRERLGEITDHIQSNKINTYTAIVMENNFMGQVMRAFGRLFTINARYINQVYFTNLEQAQEWIEKQRAS